MTLRKISIGCFIFGILFNCSNSDKSPTGDSNDDILPASCTYRIVGGLAASSPERQTSAINDTIEHYQSDFDSCITSALADTTISTDSISVRFDIAADGDISGSWLIEEASMDLAADFIDCFLTVINALQFPSIDPADGQIAVYYRFYLYSNALKF